MSFDALAPHYRWMESVLAGKKLQNCRTSFIDAIGAPRNALVVGEGRGRFITALLEQVPGLKITCVDSSRRMLEFARQDLAKRGVNARQVDFIWADVLKWMPEHEQYDLIATHFFLDCFPPDQLRTVVEKLSGAAKASAAWLLSDFQVPRSGIPRWRARAIVQSMYWFFRAATELPARNLSDPDQELSACGFQLESRRVSEWGLLRSDYWRRGNRC